MGVRLCGIDTRNRQLHRAPFRLGLVPRQTGHWCNIALVHVLAIACRHGPHLLTTTPARARSRALDTGPRQTHSLASVQREITYLIEVPVDED